MTKKTKKTTKKATKKVTPKVDKVAEAQTLLEQEKLKKQQEFITKYKALCEEYTLEIFGQAKLGIRPIK